MCKDFEFYNILIIQIMIITINCTESIFSVVKDADGINFIDLFSLIKF